MVVTLGLQAPETRSSRTPVRARVIVLASLIAIVLLVLFVGLAVAVVTPSVRIDPTGDAPASSNDSAHTTERCTPGSTS